MNPPHCPPPGGSRRAPPRPTPRPHRTVWPWLALAALLPLGWCCLDVLLVAEHLEQEAAPAQLAVAPDAGTESVPVVVDVAPQGTLAAQAGRALPPRPEAGWKRPPCGEMQVEVNGACWVLPARPDGTLPKPPCPASLFEHRGRCYQPVGAVRRPDTSMEGVPW